MCVQSVGSHSRRQWHHDYSVIANVKSLLPLVCLLMSAVDDKTGTIKNILRSPRLCVHCVCSAQRESLDDINYQIKNKLVYRKK